MRVTVAKPPQPRPRRHCHQREHPGHGYTAGLAPTPNPSTPTPLALFQRPAFATQLLYSCCGRDGPEKAPSCPLRI